MKYTCPVCGYDKMTEPPEGYYICPSCGTEFGNDDTLFTHEELRDLWVEHGAVWFSRATRPDYNWNPYQQLLNAGYIKSIAQDETTQNNVVQVTSGHFVPVWVTLRSRLVNLGSPAYELLNQVHLSSAEV